MELTLVVSWVILFLVIFFWRSDLRAWEAERQNLLNRIQARTPAEYVSMEQAEATMTAPPPRESEETEMEMPQIEPVENFSALDAAADAGRVRWL